MKIKEMKQSERPRERLIEYGSNNLSNEEILSIILKQGYKNKSVKEVSLDLLNSINSINDLKNITLEKLTSIKGIGQAGALSLLASIELGKRVFFKENEKKRIILNNPKAIYDYMKYLLVDKKQEYFYCLYLNSKKELIERKLLFMGTVDRSNTHPREIFKNAYLCSASGIVCVHNHPTGDIKPSLNDIYFTENLEQLCKMNNIAFVDHIIVGDNNYYSFIDDKRITNL